MQCYSAIKTNEILLLGQQGGPSRDDAVKQPFFSFNCSVAFLPLQPFKTYLTCFLHHVLSLKIVTVFLIS